MGRLTKRNFYTTTDVVRATGLSAGTIRNWERRGLITPRRDINGHRVFLRAELTQIRRLAGLLLPRDEGLR